MSLHRLTVILEYNDIIIFPLTQLYHEATIINLLETVLFYKVCYSVLWHQVISCCYGHIIGEC